MQTGRERVTAVLTFTHPDRPPRDLWALPYGVIAQCKWGKDNPAENVRAVNAAWAELA